MVNFLLKPFLYLILLGCLIWGATLLTGPMILSYYLEKRFGDGIQIYNLKVTPKMHVKASRVTFSDIIITDDIILNGSSRALELVWSISGFSKPRITLFVGPSELENLAHFKWAFIETSLENLAKKNLTNFSSEFEFLKAISPKLCCFHIFFNFTK